MIVKSFELQKINFNVNKHFLIHGNNKGLIEEIIKETLKPKLTKNYFKYEESEILKNLDSFRKDIFNQSFFENEKLIIIYRASDKIINIIEEIISENIDDLCIILTSNSLDKQSKIRKYFEKEKKTVCIPVYEDNLQTLSNIVIKFTRQKNINISQQIINIIVERAAGDRINLKNELEKIENFSINKKTINIQDILKITNLSENYNISDLVDSCLSKNNTKIIKILNENNFNSEDCIVILRTFLIKLKRLIKIHEDLNSNRKNIDVAISSFKPPIFWKDKDIVKQQVKSLSYSEAKNLITKTNEIELLVKKRPHSSLSVTTDFVIGHIL